MRAGGGFAAGMAAGGPASGLRAPGVHGAEGRGVKVANAASPWSNNGLTYSALTSRVLAFRLPV
jgi:hypothetical protein